MYFTRLPDHTEPGFDEKVHFSKFNNHNIIYNTVSRYANCDNHVGCLSVKTVLSGEEWYEINNHRLSVRPGQFLILNNDQTYSCHIEHEESVRSLSIFFKKEFASAVLNDAINSEVTLLNNPFVTEDGPPEFFQTLREADPEFRFQTSQLVTSLNTGGYDSLMVDECLVFLLHYLIRIYRTDTTRSASVKAIKASTRAEIYKRLCIAKDLIHSFHMYNPDLNSIAGECCLSVPQLVRQFQNVFHRTPHQYLIQIKLQRAAELLRTETLPISEISLKCGFENVSAFCRAFKSIHGVQPGRFREMI